MENNLFRKKSLESISSPDELHDYMRVTSPRLWMILGAVVVLLVGFLVYASTARMENTMKVTVQVETYDTKAEYQAEGGSERYSMVTCRLPVSQLEIVKAGMPVRIGTDMGTISFIATAEEEQEIALIIQMKHDFISLPDGTYDADLILESTTPISFLWN